MGMLWELQWLGDENPSDDELSQVGFLFSDLGVSKYCRFSQYPCIVYFWTRRGADLRSFDASEVSEVWNLRAYDLSENSHYAMDEISVYDCFHRLDVGHKSFLGVALESELDYLKALRAAKERT